jgi:phospholipid transport system substrate-binding protein
MYKIIFFSVLLLLNFSQIAVADDDAKAFVDNIASQVLAVLDSSTSSDNERRAKLIEIFTEAIEINWMAKFALGRNWQTLSPAQQGEYTKAYKNYLINTYVNRFMDYKSQKLLITSAQQVSQGNYVVKTEIVQHQGNKKNIKVDYRLNSKYSSNFGHFKIIDIVIEDVSMITSQRSEFNQVINDKGFNGLLEKLN